jgi:GH15 family glucan-1,4-alpha-glucosidase
MSTLSEQNKTIDRQASLDLALIGNCAIGALVDQSARIVWCCMPRFDSDPIFHALLDSGSGVGPDGTLAVELEGAVRSEQHYDPGTAIVRTRLFDSNGQSIEVTDFSPRFMMRDRLFHPAQLVRRIRPLSGRPRIRLIVRRHQRDRP